MSERSKLQNQIKNARRTGRKLFVAKLERDLIALERWTETLTALERGGARVLKMRLDKHEIQPVP